MRRFGAGGVAALWLGLAVAPALAGPPAGWGAREKEKDTGKGQAGWWSGLFGGKKPEANPAPVKTVADKAAEEAALRRAFMRRLAVCQELREVAVHTKSSSLEEEVDRLEEMAWRLYAERSGKVLGVAAAAAAADHPEGRRGGQGPTVTAREDER